MSFSTPQKILLLSLALLLFHTSTCFHFRELTSDTRQLPIGCNVDCGINAECDISTGNCVCEMDAHGSCIGAFQVNLDEPVTYYADDHNYDSVLYFETTEKNKDLWIYFQLKDFEEVGGDQYPSGQISKGWVTPGNPPTYELLEFTTWNSLATVFASTALGKPYGSLNVPKETLNQRPNQRLAIVISGGAGEKASIRIQGSLESPKVEENKKFPPAVIVVLALIGLIILVTLVICVARYNKNRQWSSSYGRSRVGAEPQPQSPSSYLNNRSEQWGASVNRPQQAIQFDFAPVLRNSPLRQMQLAQALLLTDAQLDKYFPEVKYEEIENLFSQKLCSICLEDFKPGDTCRELYCLHIFHGGCIQLWLKKHQDCPNCKKDMTVAEIDKHHGLSREERMALFKERDGITPMKKIIGK